MLSDGSSHMPVCYHELATRYSTLPANAVIVMDCFCSYSLKRHGFEDVDLFNGGYVDTSIGTDITQMPWLFLFY